ncbi:MFS transporter [Rossellomorea aquimaris]|uniref:MFS transporter n=1 Tax=Rossellomorea aquimaris TaxID=189382 RepID=UPI0007D067BF|nr:MFS transporter [Rossellomorea aquimaris]
MPNRFHYAWTVLILTFIALLSAQGVRLSFGAFMNPWEREFATNRGMISFIAFISYAVFGLSQPYIGKLIDKAGVRKVLSFSILLIGIMTMFSFFANSLWQLMIIYGVLASIGFGGASNVAGSVAVANWFSQKRGFALGLMSAGTAAGQLILVPLSLFLIEGFGWQQTVLLLGVFLTFIVFPLVFILIRSFPEEKGIHPYGGEELGRVLSFDKQVEKKKTLSMKHLLHKKSFLFLLLPFFVCGFTTSGLIDTHLIPFAQICGFSNTVTGAAVSFLAGFNIIGTIYSGYLADRWSCQKILGFLYGTRALTIVVLIAILQDMNLFGFFIERSHLLILFAISFGIVDFATVAPTVKLATEYFQHMSVGVVIGWLFLSHQMGAAIGSFIPGLLFDWTGSYMISFGLAIVLLIAAAAMSLSLPTVKKIEIHKDVAI